MWVRIRAQAPSPLLQDDHGLDEPFGALFGQREGDARVLECEAMRDERVHIQFAVREHGQPGAHAGHILVVAVVRIHHTDTPY